MTSAEQPVKKRKLYKPLPEPPPSSPPESKATPSSPQTVPTSSTPPLSHEDILTKRRNKDEIRSMKLKLPRYDKVRMLGLKPLPVDVVKVVDPQEMMAPWANS
ncbi:hypothetical protein JHK87_022512 [Glycine soja]|nr:hypothetical protein JHK87_022512 [Glycine soja]